MAKRYKCPYCEDRLERNKLIDHVEDEHDDLIPQGYTSTRVVFNTINKKTHGTCVVCKRDTDWNESTGKYNRLCNNPKCREQLRNEFKENAMNKHGTYNFTADPKFQEKMLKGRKISSTYKFTDGGKVDYVGSYEKKFLEFCDKVMGIESKDIIAPGPTIPYVYEGEVHHWITDFYYVPANLVLDIKDGGKNPNTRPMESYREKQTAKEESIKNLEQYNYLRLTDNNFSQFMEVLADLKSMALELKETGLITKINENTVIADKSSKWSPDANVMLTIDNKDNGVMAISSLDDNEFLLVDDDEEGIQKISREEFKDKYEIKEQFLYHKGEKYYNLLEAFKNKDDCIYKGIYHNLSSFDTILIDEQIYFDKAFRKITNKGIDEGVLDLSNKIEKVNAILELGLKDDSISITLPQIELGLEYAIESVLRDGKTITKIKVNKSTIATFNKSAKELNIHDYENISEAVDILKGGN